MFNVDLSHHFNWSCSKKKCLVCTNNICAEPCVGSGEACGENTTCCTGFACDGNVCTNNEASCSVNSDCTTGICDNETCKPCGATGWSTCLEDSQCCTGNNCIDGTCSCNTTDCACNDNSNCQSGVCESGTCAASCFSENT